MNNKQDIKEINKLINQSKDILNLLKGAEKRIGSNANFKITGLAGRNFLGDFIRNSKVSTINSSIGRLQSKLLTLHKDLLLYDESLAKKIDLPVKLEEFKSSRTVVSDIKLRVKMRSKELEVQKIKQKIKTLIRKLVKEREKIYYNIKKEAELKKFK